ncbi:MAG: hypothetical protein KatS3mg003_1208 [Candidatus Nitrosocaldaceae archaeon]|nr:MAG: hypothetical protein D6752_02605 [Candidatus Nitrosothermus koennekii]GIU71729.1 MAG: hypothetical protein KatS3mg003_1208 [Candidatus Nitrosocaldaceae archaeon]
MAEESEEDLVKLFEDLVKEYGKTQSLKMFKHYHRPGFGPKHPIEVQDNIEYVIDGRKVKVRCACGASLDLTDYKKLQE